MLKIELTRTSLDADVRPFQEVDLQIPAIGISMVDESPQEILYLSLRDFEVQITDSKAVKSVACNLGIMCFQRFFFLYRLPVLLGRFQLDNQLDECLFPIIMAPTAVPPTQLQPFLQLSVTTSSDHISFLLEKQAGVL